MFLFKAIVSTGLILWELLVFYVTKSYNITMFKIDSRQIQNGDTYICLPKGEAYIDQAVENGAVEVRHMDRKNWQICSTII